MANTHPPRPRLSLNIGITGHRIRAFTPELLREIGPVLDRLFEDLATAARELHVEESDLFDESEAILRLHTPLAAGSDQLAATSARRAGFYVRALLPFAEDDYRQDFAGRELTEFQHHLNQADTVFALPGDRNADDAYVMVGKAVIAASDILVAIWDGLPAAGPGGTAHVIDLAQDAGVPVVHVPINRERNQIGEIRLLANDGSNAEPSIERSLTGYRTLVADVLAPHDRVERQHLHDYFRETERLKNPRFEYPVLLALLGVKKLGSPWRQNSIEEDIEAEWSSLRGTYPAGIRKPLERSYAWANFLAIRYAQKFRSGHITNYALSALAVLIALTGLIVPALKLYLVILELAVIGLIFLNTRAGRKGDWHRRWLQYRHLAESLRPLLYLKRIGLAGPPFRTDRILMSANRTKIDRDWTRWYAAAIWREMASPSGEIETAEIPELVETVIAECIKPQADYHRVNAHRMRHLDHRLHEVGSLIMGTVIAACGLFIAGYFLLPWLISEMAVALVFLTAGLPAAGAAVFGMRGHGEHLLQASRSADTALALDESIVRLRAITDLEALARALQRMASIMLADLDEWTTSYSERSLEIPA
ncbi:hypothetical protein [Qipengyuania atrilutea]|uniref:SMODS and SLOG-associating 2TM effector domain-containing protein n=1 Tax=Qipengyuania atrilutea TaxID=2744473 RepID=A0A850HDX2_9SPHN|nr:hypothetical protein [Actirhodobacter atriluteus]NVD45379.1 hypothetical protein [Actirhodobacter atriluteus]